MKKLIIKNFNENKIILSKHFLVRMKERNVSSNDILKCFKNFNIVKAKQNKFKMISKNCIIIISDDFCLISCYKND